jgi:hypothetical protein
MYVEPSLHPWDEADLVMVYDLSDVLFDLACHYLHQYSLEKLAYSSPFWRCLSGLGMRVILSS